MPPPLQTTQHTGTAAQLRARISPAIILTCIGALVMMGVVYLHIPSAPVPTVHSRTLLEFPFRIKSDTNSKANPDDEADQSVILFHPRHPNSMFIATIVQRPPPYLDTMLESMPDPISESVSKSKLQRPIVQFHQLPSHLFPQSSDTLSAAPVAISIANAKLEYKGAEVIPGVLHSLAISKFTSPDPSLAFLYYRVADEGYTFHAKVVEIKPISRNTSAAGIPDIDHLNLISVEANDYSVRGRCINFASHDDNTEESCIYGSDSEPSVLSHKYSLPGNMWISRFYYTWNKGLLYTRQLDEYSFRFIPTLDDGSKVGSSEGSHETKLKSLETNGGPILDKDVFGKSLALVQLYSKEGSQTILDIRYKSQKDDTFWFYVLLNHRPTDLSSWTQTILVKSFESLRQIDDIPVHIDDYYFITNPVVAVSKNGNCAVFIYKGSLHVLDHVGSQNLYDGASHGFTMMKSRLVKSLQSDLRMRGAVIDDDGLLVSIVTDTDNVVTLRRNFTFQPRPPSPKPDRSRLSGPSIFQVPPDINFLFDARVAPQTPPPIPQKLRSTVALSDALERGTWRLDKIWSPDFLNEASVRDSSIASVALVPSSLLPGKDDEKLLVIYWHNDVLIVLNLDRSYGGSFIYSFVRDKWKMFSGMVAVLIYFVFNEIRFWARDAMLRDQFLGPAPVPRPPPIVNVRTRAASFTTVNEGDARLAEEVVIQNTTSTSLTTTTVVTEQNDLASVRSETVVVEASSSTTTSATIIE